MSLVGLQCLNCDQVDVPAIESQPGVVLSCSECGSFDVHVFEALEYQCSFTGVHYHTAKSDEQPTSCPVCGGLVELVVSAAAEPLSVKE